MKGAKRNPLNFQAAHQDQATQLGPESSQAAPKLNPLFVEWLLGCPFGMTELEPLETALTSPAQKKLARFFLVARRK